MTTVTTCFFNANSSFATMDAMCGMIALDIDGTCTADSGRLPSLLVEKLTCLQGLGWTLAFITGRPRLAAFEVLKGLSVPYFLGTQNGAELYSMPQGRCIQKNTVPTSCLSPMEAICWQAGTDFVLYFGDFVCFRAGRFREDLFHYLSWRWQKSGESWQEKEQFSMELAESALAYKCIGQREDLLEISREASRRLGLSAPVISDPYNETYSVMQATAKNANKGDAARFIYSFAEVVGPMLAAGDDWNDVEMLEVADVKIVMETAPEQVRAIADIISTPAKEMGILDALDKAVRP